MNTRAKEQVYLLGYDESQIIGAKLPSNAQVLRVLFYNMRKVKLELRASASLVVKEVEVLWNKARIPIRSTDKCVLKVESLYLEWRNLQKSSKRQTLVQEKREKDFVDKFDDLFDVAHSNALDMISIAEDKIFLINQRKKGRPGAMIGSDCKLAKKEKAKSIREKNKECFQDKHTVVLQGEYDNFESQSSDEEAIDNYEIEKIPDPMYEIGASTSRKKRGRQNFITPKLVSVLDKCKVSDRDAVRILIATAQALNHDVNDLVINATSIRRSRTKFRFDAGKKIRERFQEKHITAVTVHWDGKILPSLMGRERVDRLPVIISFDGTEQLLGIPAISSGTGKQQAAAVFDLLKQWQLDEKVEALCFDTTATNTGRIQGACVLLEQTLNKDLLYYPCRHHIFEILLRSVFEAKMLISSGPTVKIFQRFRDDWSKLDKSNFKAGVQDKYVENVIGDTTELCEFILITLSKMQPREDYKELLQLAIVFLGGKLPNFTFRKPGAFHHARWMSKAIYCLKMYLFRDQIFSSEYEVNAIRDVCIFIIKIYLKVWIKAPIATEAPNQDLTLLKSLYLYNDVDENLSRELTRKFCSHLWYISPELVALSFFDEQISNDSKRLMVAALNQPDEDDKKKVTILPHQIDQFMNKNIENFISQKTLNFFQRYSISTDFLQKDPEEWQNDQSYKIGLAFVSKLRVVNDTAERAVKLMEEFNQVLSHDEEEKQFIMQIVADYRKQYPNASKSVLLSE